MISFFFFASFFISFTVAEYEHIKEIRFKFWLNPGVVECYHQLVENSSSIYFMYEIMNRHTHEDTITVFFRNSMTGIMLKTSQSADRGHLELSANETVLIDICLDNSEMFTYVKYISVYFHVYHVDRILAKLKTIEEFDNSSVNSQNSLNTIGQDLINIREMQMEVGLLNQRDFFVLKQTYSWINSWALTHLFIILVCFSLQTVFIKRLFKTSRK